MSLQIIPFVTGINTSYIIKDQGIVMVDGAPFKKASSFTGLLERHGIKPGEIKLIVLTHGDFDHVGGVRKIKELTGAKIAIHKNDSEHLEHGIFHWPEGATPWGKLSRFLFKPFMAYLGSFQPAKADILLDDGGLTLKGYGIRGRVVHTPGHTPGSVSVLLETGDAFTGCLAHNRFPFVLRPSLPIYAKDLDLLKKSWKVVIGQGAKTIYPGHGKPFPLEKIRKYLN